MKKLFIFLIALSVSISAYSTDLSGIISADLTLTLAESPYIVTGNLTINNGANLTVEAGVEVKFNASRNLTITDGAAIVANDALFTSNLAVPAAGDWNTIDFNSFSTGTFTDCTIEYGRSIDVNVGDVVFTNTDVLNFYNYGCTAGHYGAATIIYNGGTISGDERNYGFYLYPGATVNLNGVFIENFSRGIYVGNGSNLTLENSSVTNSNYEGVRLETNATAHFQNVILSNNNYPINFQGPATVTQAGVNDLSGNEIDNIMVSFYSLSQYWYLTSFNDFAGGLNLYYPYYFISGGFTINAGGVMEIESNNILKFYSGNGLYVNGTLIAEGDELANEYIYFTSWRDDNWGGDSNNDGTATNPASKDWKGVSFNDISIDAACVLDRAKLRFSGHGNKGAVSTLNASPTINACDVSISYFGFYFEGDSDPVFSNNLVGSSDMTPIAMSIDADPLFFDTNEFSFSDNEYDAVGILGSELLTHATLPVRDVIDVPNITYLMLGTITVPETLSLTIEPSVVIKSYYYLHRIVVQGLFTSDAALGTEIVFTSVKDDTHGNPLDTNKDGTQSVPSVNDWSGIVFESTSDPVSLIDYNIIKYASLHSTYYNTRYIYDGAITLENASPTISNCEIKDIDFGIYAFQSSNPVITNNEITNAAKTPVALSVAADPTFSGNNFTNATWTALGIIGEEIGLNGIIRKRDVAGYANISYLLLEDMTINTGVYVTVEPGVVIKFLNTGIFVRGGFMADGTTLGKDSYEEIIFTSLKDDNFGNPMDTNGDGNSTAPSRGDWKTIRYEETSDDGFNLIRYAQVKFAGSNSWGNITFTDAAGLIQYVTSSEAYYYGVKCEGASTPTFDNVDIANSRLDPIAMSLKSDPTFSNITFAGNGSNGIKILEGNLGSDATLKQRDIAGINNIAYIVQYLTIQPSSTLIIEPGVVIKFFDIFSRIYVNGAMIADGMPGENIVFTSLKDDSYGGDTNNDGNLSSPSGGDYETILFNASDIDSLNLLDNCLIRYGGRNYSWSNYKWGQVRIYSAFVEIDSTSFEHSPTAGIGVFGDANPSITNNILTNIEYTPIAMSMFSAPTFSGNLALNNGLMALGIVPETYSLNNTVPIRDFGGYTNITYYVYYRSVINTGTTIVIPDGLVFKSDNDMFFDVNGGLRFEGTSENNIIFTDYRDDRFGKPEDTNDDGSATTPAITSYEAIKYNDVSEDANCLIDYTRFYYSSYGLNLQQASPAISNSQFENMNWGTILRGVSNPSLDSCAFNDLTYGSMAISLVSYPSSTANNSISGSTWKVIGVIDETLVQEVTLEKKIFAGIENIPYFFIGNYIIGTSAALTIEPGVVCKFNDDRRLTVKRSLIAEGGPTPDSTTVFTSIYDDFYGGDSNSDGDATSPDESDWRGIKFDGESLDPLCRLSHVTVQWAGYYSYDSYGAIVTENASPSISYASIINNEHGLVALGASNPSINYSDIYNNVYYGVRNVNQAFVIDATNNWWGSNSGPTHLANPGGTGDEVTDAVDYDPWLTSGAHNPIMGDVSLNGLVQAFDASLILQWVVDPVGNPLNAKQQQVADVSGNGTIMAMDASYILQYVVGLINHFPAELLKPVQVNQVSDVELIVGNADVNPGEEFTVPVNLQNVKDLSATQIEIHFDPNLMSVVEIENLTTGMNMNYYMDNQNGLIRIATASIEDFNQDLAIANLKMIAREGLVQTTETFLSVDYFAANESDLTALATSGKVVIYGIATSVADISHNNSFEVYPNPFGQVLNIQMNIETTDRVSVEVYNLFGQKITSLFEGQMPLGENTVTWDGTANGKMLENGTYLLYIMQGEKVDVVKTQLYR